MDIQDSAEPVCRQFPGTGVAGRATRGGCLRIDGENLLNRVFRVLPVDAVLHGNRQNETGTGQGGLPWLEPAESSRF